ncbi:TolC family protein [Parvularcula oceani]|uniref:TolC family protein n=1 Tax=Parvularcula oceani TaxID=1247963 RepID=UPI0012DD56C3|nr:TolC family protein [Parvularcula oceani]
MRQGRGLTGWALVVAMLLSGALAPAKAQSLQDAVAAALRTNPRLQAERALLEATGSEGAEARAAGRPSIEAGANYEIGTGDYTLGPNGEALLGEVLGPPEQGEPSSEALALGGQGGDGRFSARLGVVQPLFTGFRIRNGIRRADAATRAAEAQLALVEQSVVVETAEAYLAVVAAMARLEAALQAASRFRSASRAAQLRFEAGEATRTDTALADARTAQARGQVAAAEAALAAARAALSRLVGPDIAGRVSSDPATIGNVPAVPDNAEAAIALALANSPEIAAADAAVAAREAELRIAKGRRAPSLRARAGATYAEDQFVRGDEVTALTLTAELSVPLFEGGAISADIRGARARLRAQRDLREDARRRVEARVRTAFAQLIAAEAQADAAAARADAAALAARGAALERDVGQRTLLDLLLAEQDLAEARFARIDARASVFLAAYRLREAMGNLLTAKGVSGQLGSEGIRGAGR